jgi:chromosome segregation ATPase
MVRAMKKSENRTHPRPEDLEETAELPLLPDGTVGPATEATQRMPVPEAPAHTDSWPVDLPTLAPVVATIPTELGALRSDLADVTASRDQLEDRSRALTSSLRELEDRLNLKSEQLTVFEREVGTRDRRIAALEQELQARGEQLARAEQESGARQTELAGLRSDHATLRAAHDDQSAAHAQLQAERAQREAARVHAETLSLETQSRAVRLHELLQAQEARRELYEALLDEREQAIAASETRRAELERELADRARQAGELETDLRSGVEAQRSRGNELDHQLSVAHARIEALLLEQQQARQSHESQRAEDAARIQQQLQSLAEAAQLRVTAEAEHGERLAAEQARNAALQAEIEQLRGLHVTATRDLAAASERTTQLEDDLHDHSDMLQALREQLDLARQRVESLSADLAVAEERIRSGEYELRQRDSRLDKQAETEAQLRSEMLVIGRSLAERNALISRLEDEAASSAAVLGSIQNNLERLGTESASAASASGSHPLITSDKLTRLLVRTEGDSGIVHVLSRRTTIGRTPDNDLQIEADYISRHHAVLLSSATGMILEDLNSTNGVYVNGRRVTRTTLNDGDLVTIGRTGFRYVLKPVTDRTG